MSLLDSNAPFPKCYLSRLYSTIENAIYFPIASYSCLCWAGSMITCNFNNRPGPEIWLHSGFITVYNRMAYLRTRFRAHCLVREPLSVTRTLIFVTAPHKVLIPELNSYPLPQQKQQVVVIPLEQTKMLVVVKCWKKGELFTLSAHFLL